MQCYLAALKNRGSLRTIAKDNFPGKNLDNKSFPRKLSILLPRVGGLADSAASANSPISNQPLNGSLTKVAAGNVD